MTVVQHLHLRSLREIVEVHTKLVVGLFLRNIPIQVRNPKNHRIELEETVNTTKH